MFLFDNESTADVLTTIERKSYHGKVGVAITWFVLGFHRCKNPEKIVSSNYRKVFLILKTELYKTFTWYKIRVKQEKITGKI